jgi:hypothetical protein
MQCLLAHRLSQIPKISLASQQLIIFCMEADAHTFREIPQNDLRLEHRSREKRGEKREKKGERREKFLNGISNSRLIL